MDNDALDLAAVAEIIANEINASECNSGTCLGADLRCYACSQYGAEQAVAALRAAGYRLTRET